MIGIYGDPILYWTLKTLLLVILFVCGYMISYKDKSGKNFWNYSYPAMIAYSLEYGLRWNRSWDYPHYFQDLTGSLYMNYSDPIYLLWIDFVKLVGIDPILVFVFYSAVLIFAFMLFLKERRELAFLAMPLFMIIPTQADNHIRQYFAFALILIGYYYHNQKDWIKTIIWYLLGLGIHFSGFFCVAFIFVVKYIKPEKYLKSPWPLLIIYLLFFYFWDTSYLTGFSKWIGSFSTGEDSQMQNYINNADYWFTDESDISLKLGTKSVASKGYYVLMSLCFECGIIYYGFKIIKNDTYQTLPYWAMVFCFFNQILGGNNEIFSRFSSWVNVFNPLIVSAIVLKYPFKKYMKIVVVFFFVYFYVYVGHLRKMTTISMTGYEYVWDR